MTAELQRFKGLIAKAATGTPLAYADAEAAFDIMMAGDATPAQMAGLLMALRVRGETVDEIQAGASAMRARMARIEAPLDAMDIVGTGGDGAGTYNISTASALVAAGAGQTVAKHGNRNLSSRSGTADALIALGVNIEAPFPVIERSIREAAIGFMMAPRHHGAMRHVAGPRVELGTRTIFNLLGPLSNPAGVKRQLTGVFAPEWVAPLAEVLGRLGSERAWVVHGAGGLDEVSLIGPTEVAEWHNGELRRFSIDPGDIGLKPCAAGALKGGDPAHNARAIRNLLDGGRGPFRDCVVLGTAAALVVGGKASDLNRGAALAEESIQGGRAKRALEALVRITNEASA